MEDFNYDLLQDSNFFINDYTIILFIPLSINLQEFAQDQTHVLTIYIVKFYPFLGCQFKWDIAPGCYNITRALKMH